VFALAPDNSVSASEDGGGFVPLHGYLTAISAGLDSAVNPIVYGIGGDNAVWVDDNGAGWTSWGGYVKAISGSATNGTVFAIGGDNAVYVNRGGTGWTDLGGNFTSISAGADSLGHPEVYAIDGNHAVYSNDNGAGWVSRAGCIMAIAASTNNTVFGIDFNQGVWVNRGGTGWTSLGGYARQISAGTDVAGYSEVYAIGSDDAAYVSDNGSAFSRIGGYVTDLSGMGMGTVYARGQEVEQVFIRQNASPFQYVSSVALANPAAGAAYAPAPPGATLFNNNQPSYLDMWQGATGDCWLDASLAEVAARDPQDIKNMFVYDGTTVDNGAMVGLYSVRLFSPDGVGFSIQVDTALPSGGGTYNHVFNGLGSLSLWTALAEKAYAEANALGLVNTEAENQGSYAALNNGSPSWALQAITGNPVCNSYPLNVIENGWNPGELIVLTTGKTPTSSYLVGSHCYAVVGYNASSSQPFEVFNPYGTDSSGWAPGHSNTMYGLFPADAAFLSQNFIGPTLGTGAANVSNIDRAIEELTELVALCDGHSSSGSINLSRFDLGRRP
jgi:hypothetical protein